MIRRASEYASTLPADVCEGTLTGAINYWAANNLTAAGEWIKGLIGPARDEALRRLFRQFAAKRPEHCGRMGSHDFGSENPRQIAERDRHVLVKQRSGRRQRLDSKSPSCGQEAASGVGAGRLTRRSGKKL
jgi:hypothetical protein